MVLKRRLSYGCRGYYLPPIPNIPKPSKKKRTARKKVVQDPLAAIDMLATVAGNLLKDLDTDGVPVNFDGALNYNSSLKKEPLVEPLDQLKAPNIESLDQNSTNQSSAGASDSNPKALFEKGPDLCTNRNEMQFTTKQGETDIHTVRSISSESSSEFSLYSGGFGLTCDPNPRLLETRLSVNTDDDEKSSWCTDRGEIAKISLKRMKKSSVDKLKKAISHNKKYDAKLKGVNDSQRKCYAQQILQKNRFRRKLFHHSKISSSNSQVRLCIKSFMVPELSIEIAESASIGALKRRVMEALAAVLEGELTVGLMLEGQNVRENSRTLREAGIFCDSPLLETVEFTLEPEPVHSPLTAPHISSDSVDNRDVMDPLASDMPASNQSEDNFATPGESLEPVPVPVPTTPVKSHVTDPDPELSPIEVSSAEQAVPHLSQAIVPVPLPVVKIEPLAIAPAVRKSRQIEALGQRRMRRPFSVSEVEALVAAVEKLGTGRWRDVKICAFDSAKHRTYVDLKDKWKTLVHTATIAPQQRRGAPVPQELLDRVLAAQSYWSHQHFKLAKSSGGEQGLTDDYESSPSLVKITSPIIQTVV